MIFLPDGEKSDLAHELLHSLNLAHTFANIEYDKYAKYTYNPKMTDNIMDYSHYNSIKMVSLWDWQSEIVHESSDYEP